MTKQEQEMRKPYFLVAREQDGNQKRESSRISVQLTKAIASDRDPSFFDTEEVKERDRELLEELLKKDAELNLQRRNKPVVLSPSEAQLVYALAYEIGDDLDSEDIKEIVANPFSEKKVTRTIDLNGLSKFLNGRTSERDRKALLDRFYKLDSVFHIQLIELTDDRGRKRNFRLTQPLIRIEQSLEELSHRKKKQDKAEENKALIRISYGRVFFVELQKRYSILSPQLFDVWRRGKKGELFHVLLSALLSIYWNCYIAAQKTEKRLQEENEALPKGQRLDSATLQAKIKEAQVGAWTYELKFSSIKAKLTTDYESTGYYRFKFKKDLEGVLDDLKEAQLLTDETKIAEAKDGGKVVFRLNENYISSAMLEQKTQAKLPLIPSEE